MRSGTRLTRIGCALRSATFLVTYASYLIAFTGAGQRLIIWPACLLLPRRRTAIVRAWLRLNARATLALARWLADVQVTVDGRIAPGPCIVVMNHQSLLDIPLGINLITGPYPLIPTRVRYERGIPGISPLIRLARFPRVSQRRTAKKGELLALEAAADSVAAGQNSFLIFPEGHRTRDGNIAPFMRNGLRIALSHARVPVHCIVVDGATRSRTIFDTLTGFANMRISIRVLGPYTLTDPSSIDDFIEKLREGMTDALAQLRRNSDRPTPGVERQVASR
jgi:1-acyl-sn-glycerol-3-phosphate acyltransferase